VSTFIAAAAAVLTAAAVLVLAPLLLGEWGRPRARSRVGPLWTWCPAEACWTPHALDVGGRQRCLSCKTTTIPSTEDRRG
jgi:hypothetical protein